MIQFEINKSINLSIIPMYETVDSNFIHIQENYHFSCIAALQSIRLDPMSLFFVNTVDMHVFNVVTFH